VTHAGSGPRLWLTLASIATAAVGLWLVAVTARVLPARDPAHVPMWRAVAAGCFSYSALSAAFLARGRVPTSRATSC